MAKIVKIKIEDKTDDMLRSELGVLEKQINSKSVEWENAKGEKRIAAYSLFSHTGKLLVNREDDPEGWDAGTAVFLKVEAERRSGKSELASMRATHSIKAGTCSATVRTANMRADKSEVTCQLAAAQRLANAARAIRAELFNRAEAEKVAIAEAEKKAAEAELLAAFTAPRAEAVA